MKTDIATPDSPAGAGSSPSTLFGFLPRKSLESPSVIVTPCDEPDHAPMPLAYFVNGYQRHHEKLSGMAGDWMDNRLHACEAERLAVARQPRANSDNTKIYEITRK